MDFIFIEHTFSAKKICTEIGMITNQIICYES